MRMWDLQSNISAAKRTDKESAPNKVAHKQEEYVAEKTVHDIGQRPNKNM